MLTKTHHLPVHSWVFSPPACNGEQKIVSPQGKEGKAKSHLCLCVAQAGCPLHAAAGTLTTQRGDSRALSPGHSGAKSHPGHATGVELGSLRLLKTTLRPLPCLCSSSSDPSKRQSGVDNLWLPTGRGGESKLEADSPHGHRQPPLPILPGSALSRLPWVFPLWRSSMQRAPLGPPPATELFPSPPRSLLTSCPVLSEFHLLLPIRSAEGPRSLRPLSGWPVQSPHLPSESWLCTCRAGPSRLGPNSCSVCLSLREAAGSGTWGHTLLIHRTSGTLSPWPRELAFLTKAAFVGCLFDCVFPAPWVSTSGKRIIGLCIWSLLTLDETASLGDFLEEQVGRSDRSHVAGQSREAQRGHTSLRVTKAQQGTLRTLTWMSHVAVSSSSRNTQLLEAEHPHPGFLGR